MKKFISGMLITSVVLTVVFASGGYLLPTVICAACAYLLNNKYESYEH